MRIITPQNAALSPSGLDAQFVLNFEQDITVAGDVTGVYAPIFTVSSPNIMGGSYLITRYAEVSATDFSAGETFQLDTQWVYNATPDSDSFGALTINNIPNFVSSNAYINLDNGTTFDWRYVVANYAAGTATIKVRITLVRLA